MSNTTQTNLAIGLRQVIHEVMELPAEEINDDSKLGQDLGIQNDDPVNSDLVAIIVGIEMELKRECPQVLCDSPDNFLNMTFIELAFAVEKWPECD